MVSGGARVTAAVVARAVGLDGEVYPGPLSDDIPPDNFSVFAGVLPEDKYRLVKGLQRAGHVVACAAMVPTTRRHCGRPR
jgi:H+-transporting ATPase